MSLHDFKKRYEILQAVSRSNKLNHKQLNISAGNLYRIVRHWESIDLIILEKQGRELTITLTDKGKEYLEYYRLFSKYSDF